MPIYEYSCAQCAKVFEEVQKFSDPPVTVCPTCGSPVEKLISLTSFQLKGTGWYATDYKKNKQSSSDSPPVASPTPTAPVEKRGPGTGEK